MTKTSIQSGIGIAVARPAQISYGEIERRLAGFVREMRDASEGQLSDDLAFHIEFIAQAIGLDDEAIRRVLDTETLPSEVPYVLTDLGRAALEELGLGAE